MVRALFDLAIDSKLRGCDLVKVRIGDLVSGGRVRNRGTDIRLPGAPDGWDIARHARELRADLPVVYTTADSAAEWPVKGVPNSVVVQEPYAAAQLLTAISTLMTKVDTNRTS